MSMFIFQKETLRDKVLSDILSPCLYLKVKFWLECEASHPWMCKMSGLQSYMVWLLNTSVDPKSALFGTQKYFIAMLADSMECLVLYIEALN